MHRRAAPLVLVACLATASSVAFADPRPSAVLVGASESDPTVLRIADELRALGIDVEVVPHDSDRTRLRQRARGADQLAVVLVSESEVEVLVAVDGKEHVQYLPRRKAADPSANALAAVEIVRGLLVPVKEPEPAITPPAPALVATPARHRERTARLGAGAVVSSGSIRAQAAATLGLAWWSGRTGLEVSTVLGIPRSDLNDGMDTIWCGSLGVAAQLALHRSRSFSVIAAGGLAGLVMLHRADKDWNVTIAGVPFVSLGARVRVADGVMARIDGTFGVTIPRPELKLKNGDPATVGWTVTQLSLGVDFAW